ncbi:disease resistance protein RGA2-like [Momordica charantia]|uniref:Disease resistance protein RGA2-like n=1 Tax=Momordica charantia TaxID=3673 RepID=A0A6J1DEU3_MOMCH|nr:disease resistance protein RGA2-like [Momordica charantia]
MGGMGKTTLAKVVFNHEMIKQHFHKTFWYSIIRIIEKSENSIVVTTRSADVAKIVETLPSHHLRELSDDQCWSLFKESAGAYGLSMNSSLEVIREELVKKFGGIPVVARVLGRAVKFEGDYDRWMTILKSIVRTPLQEEKFVLSILKLSVDRLPSSSLKQCFAYCSNFPKDYIFYKEELIRMWIAQGFIQLQQERINLSMENIGDMYFNILLSRCLFQDSVKDDKGRIIHVKMHDLVHDISYEVLNDKILQLDLMNLLKEEHWKKESETIASKFRTMVCYEDMLHNEEKTIGDKIVKFVHLRVLIMEPEYIHKLPNSIGRLKHLRYLHIYGYSILGTHTIDKVPESIALLYNLQTLRIENLPMVDLSKNLRELVSLRHLEFSMNNFVANKMPPYLSKLTKLQTLSNFVVGYEKGCKITELGFLKNLKGSLKLYCLEQVKSKEEASSAKLVDKENLDSLAFHWINGYGIRKVNNQNDLEVLEGLQPHKNLQSLEIWKFEGKFLPNKIFVENLETRLYIRELIGVRRILGEFYGNDSKQRAFFPKLEEFTLICMDSLERWEEEVTVASNATTFPHLQSLQIFYCPALLNIPDHFGSSNLRFLEISSSEKLTKLPDGLQLCHSIQKLRIDHGSNLSLNLQNKNMLSQLSIGPLKKLPEELAHHMNLQELRIHGCMQNYDFSLLMHLHSLQNFIWIGLSAVLYMNGCMVEGVNGVEYDRPPCGGFTINVMMELLVYVRNIVNDTPSQCLNEDLEPEPIVLLSDNVDENIDLPTENSSVELRTPTDDEFDQLDFEGHEYNIPSDMFNDLGMNIMNSTEHDPIVKPVAIEHDLLYKGFRCKDNKQRNSPPICSCRVDTLKYSGRHLQRLHQMYRVPIPTHSHTRRGRRQLEQDAPNEPNIPEPEAIYHNVDGVPPFIKTQNDVGPCTPMVMIPTPSSSHVHTPVQYGYDGDGCGRGEYGQYLNPIEDQQTSETLRAPR